MKYNLEKIIEDLLKEKYNKANVFQVGQTVNGIYIGADPNLTNESAGKRFQVWCRDNGYLNEKGKPTIGVNPGDLGGPYKPLPLDHKAGTAE